ncbi:MAG: Na/Pi cotransporter family protein [Clostridiales bacterium]|nr:Na/Pi cotransporter family protein [Clostridiales bacterium]
MVDIWPALLGLCSGMALFLYSVKITSASLQAVAGEKLKNVLAKLTGNRIIGVLVGAGITALIQSSTATSVMSVGFVNAGLMNLYQALWVIMGANIGTNITAQIIAFDVGAVAPIIALLGTFFCLLVKDKKLRSIGEAIAGLGFIFVAMSLMKDSMEPLSTLDIVKETIASINNPFIGIIVGIIFVVIIQSSAAGVGMLQAMAMSASGSHLMSLDQAMFIIFGLNIGTCVTAVFASIGGSRNATRAGMLHMTFNVLGTAIFTVAYYVLPITTWVAALSPNDVARQLANVHLVFNLASTIILLPFGKLIVKLVKLMVPDKKGGDDSVQCLKYLNPSMISNNNQVGTEVLIRALCNEISRMLEMAGNNVQRSIEAVLENNEKTQTQINDTEEYVDYLNKEISYYISHAMVFDMSEKHAIAMSALFKITGNIERMGDHATNISGYANMLESKGLKLSDKARAEVSQMVATTKDAYNILLGSKPGSVHIKMAQMEQKIDDMTEDYREHQLERLKSGSCSGDACVIYSEMLTDFERLGDHMLNIAEAAAESNLITLKIPEDVNDVEEPKSRKKIAAAKA